MTFLERLEKVRADHRWTWRAWEREAGLTDRHLSVVLTRARQREDFRPDWSTLRALATAAGVSAEWLADGDDSERASPAPRSELRVERDPEPALKVPTSKSPLERAIGLAFDASKHDLRTTSELLAALGEIERKSFELDPQALIEPARRWLNAAHRLAARGEPITAQAVLYYLDVPRLGTEAREAYSALDREVDEKASTVVRGEGLAGLAEMQRELDESRKK